MATASSFAGSVQGTTGTTWASTTNATGATTGTVATFTSSASSATGTIELRGFNLTAIPAGSTINSVTVAVRGYVNNTGRMLAPLGQLFSGGSAIGAQDTMTPLLTTTNTTTDSWNPTVTPTLAQLQAPTFAVVITARKAANTQSGVQNIDTVQVTVDYTAPPSADTPPVLANRVSSTWENHGNTAFSTPAMNVTSGDLLVAIGLTENTAFTMTNPTNTGTAFTWTRQLLTSNSSRTPVYIWTATATATQSTTFSVTGNSGWCGFEVLRFSSHNGFGLIVQDTSSNASAPQTSFGGASTCSGLLLIAGDWNAIDGASRAWASVNGDPMTELDYQRDSARATVYLGWAPNTGANSDVAPGLNAPTTANWQIGVIEIKGTVYDPTKPSVTDTGTLSATDASSVSVSGGGPTPVNVTDTGTLSATDASANATTMARTDTGSISATDVSANSSTLSRTDTGSISATDSSSVTIVNAVSVTDTGSISATDSSAVVPSSPPAGISAPWVGTAVVGNGTNVAATNATVNVSGATNGEVVWIFASIGDAQTSAVTAPSGWNIYAQTTEGTSGGSSSRDVILWKVKGSGDTNVTLNWSVSANYQLVPVSWPGVDTTTPAEGIAWLNHTSGASYPTGTSTPTSNDRWAVAFVTSRGSTTVTAFTPDAAMTERVDVINTGAPFIGLTIADSNAAVSATSKTYTFTGQTASHGIGGLFFLIPGSTAPVTPDVVLNRTDTGSLSATDSASASPFTPTLPGRIGGVEPESHAHNPAVLAPNGYLYRVSESDTASGNHPMMFKSTDGGATWTEMDSSNRPTAQDLEGSWVAVDGTTVIFMVTRDDTVWWVPFDTTTDTWGTQETIDTGLSSSGVEQYASFVKNNDGTFWVFYSDTLSGANNQIAYRKRTGTNTYGAKSTAIGGNTAVSYTAPASIKAASDLTYVFYKDDTNNTLYYRTLTTAGTLSGANSVATGTATDNIPHTNAVYFDDAGTETVVCAYADSADILKLVVLKNGVQQTTETISSTAILMDPGSVTNGGTVAHLAVNGSTLYAVWADGATGDIFYRSRAANGTWSAISTIWNSGANQAWYVYNTVYTYGGTVRMGYVYDVTHAVDVSDLYYNEVSLGSASTPVNVSDTGSLSAIDTSANSSTLSRTDTGTFSATDSSAVFKTIALTDTGSISATDTSNVFNDRPTTDSGTFSITDTSSVVVSGQISQSANDTGSLSGLDTSSVVVNTAVAVADTGTLSAVDTSTVFKAISVTDTGSLSATDASTSSSTLSRTDTGSISTTDSIGIFYTTAVADNGSVSAVDASSVFVTGQTDVSGNDTGALSATDTSSVSVSNAVSVNDTGSLSATDTSGVFKSIALTDTGSLSATDTSGSFRTISLTDTGSISATDVSNVFNNRPGTDSGTLSAADTSSVVVSGTVSINASDTGTFGGADASVSASTLLRTDTGSISAVDSSVLFKAMTRADSGTLSALDASTVNLGKAIIDSGAISAVDASTLAIFSGSVTMKHWTGSGYQTVTLKRWNGTAYQDIVLHVWDGSQFS